MPIAHTNGVTVRKPFRLWPGVAAAALLLVLKVGAVVFPDAAIAGILGGVLLTLVIVVWWVFFSRAPWAERLGAVVLMIVALTATSRVVHMSIRGGFMGRMLPLYASPSLALALVAGALASRRLSAGRRR